MDTKASKIDPPPWIPRKPRVDELKRVSARLCGIDPDVLSVPDPGRHPRVVLARGLYVHLCRELTMLSYPLIRETLGYSPTSGHSAQIYSHQRFLQRMQDPKDTFPTEFGRLTIAEIAARAKELVEEEIRR